MRDILLLAVVAATFIYGYFVMDRLDRFLETLRPEEDRPADKTEREIPDQAGVESSCLLCYNRSCEDRVRDPMIFPVGEEGKAWKKQGGGRFPCGTLEKQSSSC